MDRKQLSVDYYRKGVKAMGQEDWNLAVEMFDMSVRFAPDIEGYQRLLLESRNQRDKDR